MKDIQYFQETYGKGWLNKWKSYKHNRTVDNNGNRLRLYWNDFDHYKDNVRQLTEEETHLLPNIHKRGFNSYHIDHKISIRYGYDNGIPEEQIADISNLHLVWWKDNIRKRTNCIIDDKNRWILIENKILIP